MDLQPSNETVRLGPLRRYPILESALDAEYDRIAKLASVICQVPLACVNFLGAHLHPFQSDAGLSGWESLSDIPFCAHTILQQGVLQVPDAREDPRFASHPLVTAGPCLRFYAGAPIRTPDGIAIGTVMVMDRVPRHLTPEQSNALQALADQVMTLLELRVQERTGELARDHEKPQADLDEIRRAEQSLRESEARYRVVAETATDGIITIDGSSNILFANSSAERIFGYSAAELSGMKLTSLMPEYLRHVHAAGIRRYQETGKRHIPWEGVRLPGLHKNGREIPLEISFGELVENGTHIFTGIVRDVSERERAEKALQESQRTLSTLMANLPGMAYRCLNDPNWSFEFASEGCRDLTGYSPDDFVQRRIAWNDLIHLHDRDAMWEIVQQAIAAGCPFHIKYRIRTASGQEKWLSEHGRAIPDPAGGPFRLEGFIHDITPQIRAEQHQAALHLISEAAHSAPTLQAMLALIHSTIQQLMPARNFYVALAGPGDSLTFPYFVDEEDAQPPASPLRRGLTAYVLRTGKSALVPPEQFEELRRQGEVDEIGAPSIDWLGVTLKLENRVIGAMVVQTYTEGVRYSEEHLHILEFVSSQVAASIERKRAHDALRKSSQSLALHIEKTPLAAIEWNLDFEAVAWNPGAERIFGFSCQEALGRRGPDLIVPPAGRPHVQQVWRNLLEQKGGTRSTNENITRDGSLITCDWYNTPLVDEFGNVIGVASLCVDISERIRAEQAVRRSEEHFRALVENSSEVFVLLDRDARVRYAGRAIERVLGYTPEERRGGTAFDLFHPDELPVVKALMAECLRKPGVPVPVNRTRMKHKDGTWRNVEGVGVNRLDDPAVGAIVVTYRDVTERVRLEEQLYQSQKFEAIGQLAGGVAHDFNNLLGAMMGWAELGLAESSDPQARDRFQKIFTQTERGANLTRQLLAFARRQRLEARNIDLNQSVKDVIGLLEKVIGAHITVRTRLADDLGVTRADPTQLEQVLMNLCVNARDAMPDGGELHIQTRNVELDADNCGLLPGSRPGQFVLLEVSDTGTGIDAASLPRIFEPFFTTKGKEKGTGLGLATVYGIVKQHDGLIYVDSEPGQGATFRIYLPAVAAVADPQGTGETLQVRGGAETILVAEDNEGIRKSVCDSLQALGYRLLVAEDGQVAVELLRQNRSEVSLVLLDVAMPRRTGPDAYAQISALVPGIPVIFATGYGAESTALASMIEKGTTVLQKPYSLRLLAGKIRELLDQSARLPQHA